MGRILRLMGSNVLPRYSALVTRHCPKGLLLSLVLIGIGKTARYAVVVFLFSG